MIDGMMTVIQRLAQSRAGELTTEEEAQAACALRELSKLEERSPTRDRDGKNECEGRRGPCDRGEDGGGPQHQAEEPTSEDNNEEVILALTVARTLGLQECRRSERGNSSR